LIKHDKASGTIGQQRDDIPPKSEDAEDRAGEMRKKSNNPQQFLGLGLEPVEFWGPDFRWEGGGEE